MIANLPRQEQSWLEIFFSGRNALSWTAINNQSAPNSWLEQVQPWINSFLNQGEGAVIVLPVFDSHGPSQWYGMTSNARNAAMLTQELTALVGPSYSDFSGQSIKITPDDLIECALFERFGKFIYRLNPVISESRRDIAQAIQLYLKLCNHRPPIPDRTQRPFGRIRSDFDRALLVGNEVDAQQLREELVGTGRLNAEQQKYLEIRLLAGLGLQQQLAQDYSLIRSVLDLSPPSQVLADIIKALYVTYISPVERDPDFQATISVFRMQILQGFGPLFRERKGIRSLEVLKAFLLYELAQVHPDITRCDDIVANYPVEGIDYELVLRWRKSFVSDVHPQEIVDLRVAANKALGDENYESALELCLSALPEQYAYSGLLRCAVELGDNVTIVKVLDLIIQAPEAVRNAWSKRDLARLEMLQTEPSSVAKRIRPETDWLSWVTYVQSGNFEIPPLKILDESLVRWNVESYASDPQLCKKLANIIGNSSGEAEQIFRSSFTQLVEFFANRQSRSTRTFAPIYLMLINAVAWNGVVSQNELELSSVLVNALIDTGPNETDYTEALDAYSEILVSNSAPANIDWALNSAEIFAVNNSPNKEASLRFFLAVVDMARESVHRLSTVQRGMLALLANDYGCHDLLNAFPLEQETETDEEKATLKNFSGLIGIYTLTESAALRARQFLRKILPNARVEINTDMASTDRLKQLASNADIFVFAWKSSKHQAYYAVKDARGDRATLLPLGKGSASILNCVFEELSQIKNIN
jgi:hypothetical protein